MLRADFRLRRGGRISSIGRCGASECASRYVQTTYAKNSDRLDPRYRLAARSCGRSTSALRCPGSFGESMTRAVHPCARISRHPSCRWRFSDRRGAHGCRLLLARGANGGGVRRGRRSTYAPGVRERATRARWLWREKKREDRLRRQCDGVIRIIWAEHRVEPRASSSDLLLARVRALRPSSAPADRLGAP